MLQSIQIHLQIQRNENAPLTHTRLERHKEAQFLLTIGLELGQKNPTRYGRETLFISHEKANFLFSAFSIVQGETRTPKIVGCCKANFSFLPALKIGIFRGKWTFEWLFKPHFSPAWLFIFESMVKLFFLCIFLNDA